MLSSGCSGFASPLVFQLNWPASEYPALLVKESAFKQHFDKITFCNNQHFGDVLDTVVLRISLRFVGVASRDHTHSALYI